MYDIGSIEALIDALGGPTVLGSALGISQEAVSNWKARDQIGTCWHLRLIAMALREGLTINPAVFGMSEDDWRFIFGPLSLRAEANHATIERNA